MSGSSAIADPGFFRRALASRSVRIGFAITAVIAAMALLSLVWTPYDVTRLVVADRMQPPSASHWFGTDQFGRDVLSMIMVGARNRSPSPSPSASAWPSRPARLPLGGAGSCGP